MHVQRVLPELLASHAPAERSAVVRERVTRARELQTARYSHTATTYEPDGRTNASAPVRLLGPVARLDADARALLVRAANQLSLSARSYHRVLRVARTIADLDCEEGVSRLHIGEALRYRPVVAADTVVPATTTTTMAANSW
ncbi:MAG: hypothetical protein ABJB66_10550 [Gemmatimonadaceae bacterium]